MRIDKTNHLKGIFSPSENVDKYSETHGTKSPVSQKSTDLDQRLLPPTNVFSLKGFHCNYTAIDAAISLWQRENTIVWRDEPESMIRLRARLRCGNLWMTPSQKELRTYLNRLRKIGLDGQMDWHGFTAEFKSLQNVLPEDLVMSLDYMVSRYVSVQEKLKRNFSEGALAEQTSKLEGIGKAGITELINQFTQFLRSSLGITDLDAQAVRASMGSHIKQRVYMYSKVVEQTQIAVSQTALDGCWLCNHDAYIAARLRENMLPLCEVGSIPSEIIYSAHDLAVASWIAQAYLFEIERAYEGNRNEAQLAINLAFADMKEETLIQRDIISSGMAVLLRNSRTQGHTLALDALMTDEPVSLRTIRSHSIFRGIYETILNTFHQNRNDVAEAIRAGVSFGETATTQVYGDYQQAVHWRTPVEQYWATFYEKPDVKSKTISEQKIEQLLAPIGRSPRKSNSAYQNYINEWENFLRCLDKI